MRDPLTFERLAEEFRVHGPGCDRGLAISCCL